VVAITALAMEGDRQRVLDSGCDECITKPISVADFRARMAALLGGSDG
jgi:DNA-binding response OmpR family regulator